MKFTLSWLNKYLEPHNLSLEEISQKLTNLGLEVESIEDKAKDLKYFSVAKILEAKPHENSNKLKICSVETFDEISKKNQILQIICGAKNARTGLKVAYAPIGAEIPGNGMKIKKARIAGIESNGMLCSATELGIGSDDEGIIEISEKYEIGEKIAKIYGFDDVVIEINVTPNRADCLGIYGIAQDLAASGIVKLKDLEIPKNKPTFSNPIKIINEIPESCPQIGFRYIKNVKNCQSPDWLKKELAAIGVNSISAIVDITNYLMISLNRPMHAYDASKISGNKVIIRNAKNNENFTSLKDIEYCLNDEMIAISDESKIIGLAGIIGSQNSTCELDSTNILLEAAFFNPIKIANAGRNLKINSDARHRFERGVDANTILSGIEIATKLILDICGGEISEIDFLGKNPEKKEIKFDFNQVKSKTGIEVSKQEAIEILQHLQFEVLENSENKFLVKIPTHRHDIFTDEDLVEEIIRIYGYNHIKKTQLPVNLKNSQKPELNHKIRSILSSKGMKEIISWSFIDNIKAQELVKINENLILENPIAAHMNYMRPNLLSGLLENYQKNSLRGFVNLSLFEIGNIFIDVDKQELHLAGIRAGNNLQENHYQDVRKFDIFDVKKDAFNAISASGLDAQNCQISTDNLPKYYHSHRSACLKLGKNIIGYFGEINPKILKKFEIKGKINFFEINLNNLPNSKKSPSRKVLEINDLPISQRDFAFIIDENIEISKIINAISTIDKKLIKNIEIFDIYRGEKIEENKKSVALRIEIQGENKTLNSEEIEEISNKIIDKISNEFSGILRDS